MEQIAQPNREHEGSVPSFVPYTLAPRIERELERHLGARSPVQLPERHRGTFVKWLPWVSLLFLPLHFTAVLFLLGASTLAALTFASFGALFSALVSGVCLVLVVLALPGLFKRTRQGWTLFIDSLAVSALLGLTNFSLFALAFSVLLFWLAFQVKYHYR